MNMNLSPEERRTWNLSIGQMRERIAEAQQKGEPRCVVLENVAFHQGHANHLELEFQKWCREQGYKAEFITREHYGEMQGCLEVRFTPKKELPVPAAAIPAPIETKPAEIVPPAPIVQKKKERVAPKPKQEKAEEEVRDVSPPVATEEAPGTSSQPRDVIV